MHYVRRNLATWSPNFLRRRSRAEGFEGRASGKRIYPYIWQSVLRELLIKYWFKKSTKFSQRKVYRHELRLFLKTVVFLMRAGVLSCIVSSILFLQGIRGPGVNLLERRQNALFFNSCLGLFMGWLRVRISPHCLPSTLFNVNRTSPPPSSAIAKDQWQEIFCQTEAGNTQNIRV